MEQIYIPDEPYWQNYAFMPSDITDYSNEDFANIAQAGMEFETRCPWLYEAFLFDDGRVATDESLGPFG